MVNIDIFCFVSNKVFTRKTLIGNSMVHERWCPKRSFEKGLQMFDNLSKTWLPNLLLFCSYHWCTIHLTRPFLNPDSAQASGCFENCACFAYALRFLDARTEPNPWFRNWAYFLLSCTKHVHSEAFTEKQPIFKTSCRCSYKINLLQNDQKTLNCLL